jgi:putative ABC transport system ATP-binding protein
MAYVEIENLTKHYRQGQTVVRALDGVTLSVDVGEFIAVVGRSGSGKTTLLDCLGLLLRPTSGSFHLDGVDTRSLGERARAELRGKRIGFIFQEFNLLPGLNALENVMLPLRYQGNRKGGRQRAQSLLREVGLEERMQHRPDQLSGGEQQRVAIARSLINSPRLVLGDEPTGEVDTETSQQLVALMRRVNREHGTAFMLVTHDLEVAAQTDRVVRLKDGHVLSDLRARPEQSFLAQLDIQGGAPGPQPA